VRTHIKGFVFDEGPVLHVCSGKERRAREIT